jgi:hypothetical protein
MSDKKLANIEASEIWVDVFEASEMTGYSVDALRKVIARVKNLPEEEREITLRKRTNRWELWLPDILSYMSHPNRGPNRRSKSKIT